MAKSRRKQTTLTKRAANVGKQVVKRFKASKRKTAKAAKRAIRAVKKTRAKIRKSRKRRQAEARKAARAQQKARTQLDLTGDADVAGSVVIQALGDTGASKPGEPPKMRTGKGRRAIKAQLRMRGKKLESRVYVDKKIAPYMAMWEFRQDGQQRPFLRPALMNNLNMIGETIGTQLKQSVGRAPKQKAKVK